MSTLASEVVQWWLGGRTLMPIMALVAVVLYTVLAERSLVLWGVRRRHRDDAMLRILSRTHQGEHDQRWLAWAGRYIELSEAEQLSRGFGITRALTTTLPLLGLLGTVSGMVDTFSMLGYAGSHVGSAAKQASEGIGLALTTTQFGMALAIPAVGLDWLLGRRVAQLAHDREVLTAGLAHASAPSPVPQAAAGAS
jgi:biopolymer transport protein ExbB/TolQ